MIFKWLNNSLNFFMALALVGMTILVFGNVVLRYFFNSGITYSEEMSRFLFVWMIFLGAIIAFKRNEHIGIDLFFKRLPPKTKKVVYLIRNILILFALWLVLEGSWKLVKINMNTIAPATGISMSFVYGIGLITSLGMALIVFYNLYIVFIKKQQTNDFVTETDEIVVSPSHGEEKSIVGEER
ncbi:TRAP transporter small permease [Bacillus sp. FJAT-45350]|uniref:TRAP transporter small permease n=1 Tax=Bacillus sp. FJAT-45350 TaxID=2011014 RepID=UPI000BB79DCA|nr:TRAP transporter small permease [Bacillus sp. FJAT-45350]